MGVVDRSRDAEHRDRVAGPKRAGGNLHTTINIGEHQVSVAEAVPAQVEHIALRQHKVCDHISTESAAVRRVEHEPIGTRAAGQFVVTQPAGQEVVPRTAVDDVVAGFAGEHRRRR